MAQYWILVFGCLIMRTGLARSCTDIFPAAFSFGKSGYPASCFCVNCFCAFFSGLSTLGATPLLLSYRLGYWVAAISH